MSIWLTCIDTAPDRGLFAVGRVDGAVIIADLETGRPRWAEPLHGERVSAVAFADGLLWTAGFDGRVAAWDLEGSEVRRRFDAGHGRVLSLCPAGDALLTAGDDGNVRVWEPETGSEARILDEKRFGGSYAIAATPEWIAIGYESGDVGVWRPSAASESVAAADWQYEGHFQPAGRGPLYAIAVSPPGGLAAFARDRAVCLHEPGEWPQVARLPIPLACNDLRFNSKTTLLIGACSDREVKLWGMTPMVGSRHGHWTTVPASCGEGMRGEDWRQEMIFSGAGFAGDDRILAASFDGAVRVFSSQGFISPLRTARLGDPEPSGWDR